MHLVITELPYQTNKAALVEKIAELVKDKKIEGISEVRDESDRQGMRIVIELRRDAQPNKILNNLYKYTAMQSAFYINMLALVDGQPRVINLKEALHLLYRLPQGRDHPAQPVRPAESQGQGTYTWRVSKSLWITWTRLSPRYANQKLWTLATQNLMTEIRPFADSGAGYPGYAVAPPGPSGTAEDRR